MLESSAHSKINVTANRLVSNAMFGGILGSEVKEAPYKYGVLGTAWGSGFVHMCAFLPKMRNGAKYFCFCCCFERLVSAL